MTPIDAVADTPGGWPRSLGVDEIGAQLRAAVRPTGDADDDRMSLVRMATLAANSHNTQPWRFRLASDGLCIEPDWERRCPAVDPDDHHLWASLGCAVENIVVAAPALGYAATVMAEPRRGVIRVALERRAPESVSLIEAMLARQCTRAPFESRALSVQHLDALSAAALRPGVRLTLVTERERLAAATALIVEANDAQVGDRAFVRELTSWIRFNSREAVAKGDGLSGHATGNPSIPSWLGRRIFPLIFSRRAEATRIRAQMQGCAGLALFSSDQDDPLHWIEAGRAYQHFALEATRLGIRNAFLNQPVEVPSMRERFAEAFDLGGRRIDLVVRFGFGQPMPMSLRRRPGSLLVEAPA